MLLATGSVGFDRLVEIWPELQAVPVFARSRLEADALYSGYVPRQEADIAAFRRDQALTIPADFDYMAVSGLSIEARQKLTRLRPATLGHAARIDGVTPAALGLILAWLRRAPSEKPTRCRRRRLIRSRNELPSDLDVSRESLARLKVYVALLMKWQGRINLIGPAGAETIWTRHVADSLQLLPLIGPRAGRVVDLGSGAGFPGLVLAIMLGGQAGNDVHLIESNGKKVAFLRQAARITDSSAGIHHGPDRADGAGGAGGEPTSSPPGRSRD